MAGDDDGVPRLADKLNWLIDNIREADGKKTTTRSLADHLRSKGIRASSSQIGHLRTGYRTAPSWHLLDAISDHFGVPGKYWIDETVEQAVRLDVAQIDSAHRLERAQLVSRIAALSSNDLVQLRAALDALDT